MRWSSTRGRYLGGGPARVVANLPYNIATALLVGWLTAEPWPPWYDRLVLMFQREVAERIVAKPGSKTYGRLSVLARLAHRGEDPVRHRALRLRAAAEGDVVGRAARTPPRAPALRPPRARARHRGGVRTAAQDAAREPEIARRSIPFRCSKRPASTRPRARRILRSKASSRSRKGLAVMTRMIRQSMTAYATPLCETVVEAPEPRGTRSAGAHQPLRRVPFRHPSAGRLLQPRRRQEARRHRADAALASLHARPRDRRRRREGRPRRQGRDRPLVRGVSRGSGAAQCAACRAGEENLCAAPRHLGIQVDGGFATHVLVPHPRYLIDHAGLPAALAGAYMCSGLTAYSALKRIAEHAETRTGACWSASAASA